MTTTLRWTLRDLDLFPEPLDDTRYEIIDGELYVTRQPSLEHQSVCVKVGTALDIWSTESEAGAVFTAPGVIFPTDEAVAPDIVWISRERLPLIRGADRKLHAAPDLVVEVLSPGQENAARDREIKLDLYSRQGVREYWLVDWELRAIAIYRREAAALRLAATLYDGDVIESPLLPGFRWPVERIFAGLD
ncbi:MAG: Uma2 family endonuclease [Chloroflexi bacterium]|nr:Uma2 family endonuclease [Chloroflexota bacterium]